MTPTTGQVISGPGAGFDGQGFELDPSAVKLGTATGDTPDFGTESGRSLFRTHMISGLNRIPVIHHMAYILGGVNTAELDDDLPFPIDRTAEGLIVDGTIVIERFQDKDGNDTEPIKFLTNIIFATEKKVIQFIPGVNFKGKPIWRFFIQQDNDTWEVFDTTSIEEPRKHMVPNTLRTKNEDSFFVFPNGQGLIFPAQWTLKRLEEIKLKVRVVTNNAVSLIISGYGGNLEQTKEAFNSGKSKVIIPSDVTVTVIQSNNLVEQYHIDWESLLKLYFMQMNMTVFDDSAQESGVARRMRIQPMLHYIRQQRANIVKIYKTQPFTGSEVEVEFDPMITSSPEERKAELELLIAERDIQAITPEEFNKRAKSLVM